MSNEALESLGIDLESLKWQDLALCSSTSTENFFDNYESDREVAKVVDEMCLSCPVIKQCLDRGVSNSEWGVWGGVFLTSGKPDSNRNSHKTQEVWEEVRGRIDE